MFGAPDEVLGAELPIINDAMKRGKCHIAYASALKAAMLMAAHGGCARVIREAVQAHFREKERKRFGIRRPKWGKPPEGING
jgi:hypothetical protein